MKSLLWKVCSFGLLVSIAWAQGTVETLDMGTIDPPPGKQAWQGQQFVQDLSPLPPRTVEDWDRVLKQPSVISQSKSNRSQHGSDPDVLPFYMGDGWKIPKIVDTLSQQDIKPSVATDPTGRMWAVMEYDGKVTVYSSVDGGLSWSHLFDIVNSNNGSLSHPRVFVDPGRSPSIVYISFSSYWRSYLGSAITDHYGVEAASFEADKPSTTFQSTWVDAPFGWDLLDPVIGVERGCGYGNTVFIAARGVSIINGVQSIFAYKGSRFGPWTEVLQTGDDRAYRGDVEIWAQDGVVYAVYKHNPSSPKADNANILHILHTTDRGQSWVDAYWELYPITSLSVAGAPSTQTGIVVVNTEYAQNDHDVYLAYTLDNGASWAGYWMEADHKDTKQPRVCPEATHTDVAGSHIFYFAEFYDTDGDGVGNIKFLTCPVADIQQRDNWKLPGEPPMLDSLVIPNEAQQGVSDESGSLYLLSRFENGGNMPVLIWNTPYISLKSMVYFTRPVAPVYSETREAPKPHQDIRVWFQPNLQALVVEGQWGKGARLSLYDPAGRLVAVKDIKGTGGQSLVPVGDIPQGVYLFRVMRTGGSISITR